VCGRSLSEQNVLAAGDQSAQSFTGSSAQQETLTGLLAPQALLRQRYRILNPAGRGGFGAVYRALDTQFGDRMVAIKEMGQSSLNSQEQEEAEAAFRHEAVLLASLTHPNLPRIYEQFSERDRLYLVMDFIDGTTLESLLEQQGTAKLPLEQVFSIALQLCSVLEYLHTRQPPIIFRDLKPANVMVTASRHIYLIDFGIARIFKPGQEKDTTALGSYGYAPPEQYGKSQTTVRSDIYSLGATLHQLLSGEDPSETPFQFSPLHLSGSELAGLSSLVMRMVSVDAQSRPASIALVRQDLQQISSYLQSSTLIIAASGTTLPPLPARSASAPGSPASSATTPPGKSSSSTTGTSGKRTQKRTSPPQIYPQANMLFVCQGHSSRITSVVWSPDGKYLASASYDKSVQIWDAASGKNLATYRDHSGRVNAIAWSPDSSLLASASDDLTVRIWHPTNLQTMYVFTQHSGLVNALTWSPDGQYIASAGDDGAILVWEAQAEAHDVLFTYSGHTDSVLAVDWSPDGHFIASAGKDRVVRIWEPEKLRQKRSWWSTLLFPSRGERNWGGYGGQIPALAWAPDNHRLASVCGDYQVRVRSLHSGHLPISLNIDRTTLKNTIAWSPSGKHLAIGGNDKLVRLWNVVARKETYIYHGHSGYVISLAWSPDGSRIASAGVDRTIQVWQTR
jgi:WD40 repeat protein